MAWIWDRWLNSVSTSRESIKTPLYIKRWFEYTYRDKNPTFAEVIGGLLTTHRENIGILEDVYKILQYRYYDSSHLKQILMDPGVSDTSKVCVVSTYHWRDRVIGVLQDLANDLAMPDDVRVCAMGRFEGKRTWRLFVAKDPSQPTKVRVAALRGISGSSYYEALIDIISDRSYPDEVRESAATGLWPYCPEPIYQLQESIVSDASQPLIVRVAVMGNLTLRSISLKEKLVLDNTCPVPLRVEALRRLPLPYSMGLSESFFDKVKPLLYDSETPMELRKEILQKWSGKPGSTHHYAIRDSILGDASQPDQLRIAAMKDMGPSVLQKILLDPSQSVSIRVATINECVDRRFYQTRQDFSPLEALIKDPSQPIELRSMLCHKLWSLVPDFDPYLFKDVAKYDVYMEDSYPEHLRECSIMSVVGCGMRLRAIRDDTLPVSMRKIAMSHYVTRDHFRVSYYESLHGYKRGVE